MNILVTIIQVAVVLAILFVAFVQVDRALRRAVARHRIRQLEKVLRANTEQFQKAMAGLSRATQQAGESIGTFGQAIGEAMGNVTVLDEGNEGEKSQR